MKFNYNDLKQLIKDEGFTQGQIAEKLGVDRISLNYKLNGRYYFTAVEIVILADILDIKDFRKYFFNKEV